MKMITAFEESFSTTENPPNTALKDYDQVFPALKFSIDTAETAFTRGAKKELKQALTEKLKDGFSMKESSECLSLRPFWVSDNSVSVSILQEHLGFILSDLVQNLAAAIAGQVKDRHLILVDPLQTRLVQIEAEVYQFRLKQKWTITVAPKENP